MREEAVYNRREFLLHMTIVAMLPHSLKLFDQQLAPMISQGLDKSELQFLRAVMAMIVPAGDRMPAVTSVGGVEYLQFLSEQNPSIQEEIKTSLAALTRVSQAMFETSFEELSHEKRIRLLHEFDEHAAPNLFASLVRYVYEAYYAQPDVVRLFGCDLRPTYVTDRDEEMLLPVRKMGRRYIEVK